MKALLLMALIAFPGGLGGPVQFDTPAGGGVPTDPVREMQFTTPNDFWFTANQRTNGDCANFPAAANNWAMWWMGEGYLDLTRAWTIATGSDDIVVAVLDLEVLGTHPDLAGNLWENAAEAAGTPGVDDDGNGLIDDINGWDFVAWDNTPWPDYTADGADIYNFDQHGTQMASLIGAQGNNESWTSSSMTPNKTTQKQGVTGVCWDVGILPCTVFSSYTGHADAKWSSGQAGNRTIDLAIEYICALKESGDADVRVCNLSTSECTFYGVSMLDAHQIIPVVSLYNETREFAWVWNPVATSDSVITCSGVQANFRRGGYWIASGQPSYSTYVDVCGYTGATLEWWYDYAGGTFESLSPATSNRPGLFTVGWEYDGTERPAWDWCSNYMDDGLSANEVVPMIRPTGALSSGSAATVSGVLALMLNWTDMDPDTAKDRLIRGCKNVDSFNTTTGAYYEDGEWHYESAAGKLGYGSVNAYRSMTLWGTVRDTTFSGDVYISGDTSWEGTITCNDGTTFWVSPNDIYEDKIEVAENCRPGDLFTRGEEHPVRLSPNGVSVYLRAGSQTLFFGTVTFRSWAETPGSADWEGVLEETGSSVLGSPTVLNAAN